MNGLGGHETDKKDAKETIDNLGSKIGGDIQELTLDMASSIAQAAISTIKRNGFNPVTV